MNKLIPHKKTAIDSYPVLDETLLYDSDRDAAFSLNVSASAVWDLCNGTNTIEDICRLLSADTAVSPDVLFPQVEQIIGQFSDLGLIELLNGVDEDSKV